MTRLNHCHSFTRPKVLTMKFLQASPIRIFCPIILLFICQLTIAQPISILQPSYPVQAAVIQYNQQSATGNDTLSHPTFRITFADYGALVFKEKNDELTLQMLGAPHQKSYRDGYLYLWNEPKGCITRKRVKAGDYASDFDGFIQMTQDLLHHKINKSTSKSFISFGQTGTVVFLGRKCSKYEYLLFNSALSSKDKIELLVYHDICLSYRYYLGGALLSSTYATGFEENGSVSGSTFEIPQNLRMIDGDKIAGPTPPPDTAFSTLIVNFTSSSSFRQMKEEGKKRLFLKNGGRDLAEEYEGFVTEFSLSAEPKHYKKIRDQGSEIYVNFITKTVISRNLTTSNAKDKTPPDLDYYLENALYDTTVKPMGEAVILGKKCKIFSVSTGIEKLEISEWKGVIIKVKKYICTDSPACKEYQFTGEETAVSIQENVSIPASVFEYPEEFTRN